MTIQGLRDTSTFVANQRPLNWRAGILMLYPNGKAPLTGLTAAMNKRTVDDPEYNWWEKAFETRRVEITTTLLIAATAVVVANGGAKGIKLGDILYSEASGEMMHVTADPSDDIGLTVSRGAAGTTAFAITLATDNPWLTVIGSAYEEGSLAPTGVNFDPTKVRNYTQIFRNTLEMTRTAANTRLRTGDAIREAKRECLEVHSVDMERAYWFGNAYEGVLNGKPWRFTGGVLSYVTVGNTKTYSTAVKMTDLEEDMYNIFKFGSSEKMGFCGNRALLTINQTVRKNGHMNIETGIKEFGMNVSRLTSPFGDIVLKTHPLFNQMEDHADGNGMESSLVVLDMENIKYVNFKGADTKYQKKLEENGLDGQKSGYLTESGIEVHHPATHYRINGMTSGAVDA